MGPMMHWTSPNRQPNLPGYGTTLFRDPHSYPASDIWWPRMRPVQTCSLEDPPPVLLKWLLKHVWLASEKYASYWNILLSWYKLWKHSAQKSLQTIVRMIFTDLESGPCIEGEGSLFGEFQWIMSNGHLGPPMNRMTVRHDWKLHLSETSSASGDNNLPYKPGIQVRLVKSLGTTHSFTSNWQQMVWKLV